MPFLMWWTVSSHEPQQILYLKWPLPCILSRQWGYRRCSGHCWQWRVRIRGHGNNGEMNSVLYALQGGGEGRMRAMLVLCLLKRLASPGKRQHQLRACFHLTGRWQDCGGHFLIHGWSEAPALCGRATPGQVVLHCIKVQAEWGTGTNQ